jgi:hypothetical protein
MDWAFDIHIKMRRLFSEVLQRYSLEQLNQIPDGFRNNIIWNIGHIIATQQILVYQFSNCTPLVSQDFINTYRKGTSPQRSVDTEEIYHIEGLLSATSQQTKTDYNHRVFKRYKPYTTSTKSTLNTVEEAVEFNNSHEGMHLGYILALQKLI